MSILSIRTILSSASDLEAEEAGALVRTLHQNVLLSSSSETPMDEWSSLDNVVFKSCHYDPEGSNVCTKYIPLSDSEIFRHPYYDYPGIKDPGILNALLESEDKIYSLDGRELYLDLCEEMNVAPVKKFHRGMLDEVIDLRYYGVNPAGVRPMCLALASNRYVRRLDLTSNFLSEDSCYHLGRLLGESITLRELVLSECSILAKGMHKLTAFLSKRVMDVLDLSKNNIGDQGFQYLVSQLKRGAIIKRLNLSHNHLGMDSAIAFADALQYNNTVTHLDLSWNEMSSPTGINELLRQLRDSTVLLELNLSWNALTVGTVLKNILAVPTLRIIDLSNNRLSTTAVKAVVEKLHLAKQLDTLDLSFNPLSPSDAFMLLNNMRFKEVKLKNLFMDNVVVENPFIQELNEILALQFRKNLKVTHGKVIRDYKLSDPDMREIILKRIDFLTSKASKKCRLDMALYFLNKYKERKLMQPRDVLRDMKMANAPVDEDLVVGLANTFPGPRTDKGELTIELAGIVEMIERMWPDMKLPPTPPELEADKIIKKKKNIKKKV